MKETLYTIPLNDAVNANDECPFCYIERSVEQDLLDFTYQFVQKESMQGVVVGGNIRCLLKLAGTEYFPDIQGKILLLEARSGQVPQMVTYLNQLKQMGVFDKVSGILLGTFTEMDSKGCKPDI